MFWSDLQLAAELSPAARWVDMADPLHFGDFAGWPVKLLWVFLGLAPAGFVFTGLWLWRDRRR